MVPSGTSWIDVSARIIRSGISEKSNREKSGRIPCPRKAGQIPSPEPVGADASRRPSTSRAENVRPLSLVQPMLQASGCTLYMLGEKPLGYAVQVRQTVERNFKGSLVLASFLHHFNLCTKLSAEFRFQGSRVGVYRLAPGSGCSGSRRFSCRPTNQVLGLPH